MVVMRDIEVRLEEQEVVADYRGARLAVPAARPAGATARGGAATSLTAASAESTAILPPRPAIAGMMGASASCAARRPPSPAPPRGPPLAKTETPQSIIII